MGLSIFLSIYRLSVVCYRLATIEDICDTSSGSTQHVHVHVRMQSGNFNIAVLDWFSNILPFLRKIKCMVFFVVHVGMFVCSCVVILWIGSLIDWLTHYYKLLTVLRLWLWVCTVMTIMDNNGCGLSSLQDLFKCFKFQIINKILI